MHPGKVLLIGFAGVALFAVDASAAPSSWNIASDWSGVNNPNGAWSYGKKWDFGTTGGSGGATVDSFELMTIRWSPEGWASIWSGPYAPSMNWKGNMWANDNSNGFPVIRWTSPQAGLYSLDATFTGADNRGTDTNVYVTVSGSLAFHDHIEHYLDTAHFSAVYSLAAGEHIDFGMQWTGIGVAAYNWTVAAATITTIPAPGAILLGTIGAGLVGWMRRRRTL